LEAEKKLEVGGWRLEAGNTCRQRAVASNLQPPTGKFPPRTSSGAQRNAPPTSNPQGFTLLEVMVSMVLIATALVAVLHLQSQNLELQSEARFMTTARLLAQERIAWLAGNPEGFREGRDEGGFGEDHPEFRYMQEISRTGLTGSLYRVTLEVFDDETKRSERSFSVETFMYRKRG